MNGANSGQAIPLKWTLKDFNGEPGDHARQRQRDRGTA